MEKVLINLEYLSILELNGKGSFDLLQGQITSDMEKVSEDNCVLGSICDVKGRVISSFVTSLNTNKRDSYFMIGDKIVLEKTKTILEKYQPFYDCAMSLNNEFNFYCIKQELLQEEFHETDLSKSFQNYESFFRLHYLDKDFHLVASKEISKIGKYNLSDDDYSWKLDEIKNKNFEITHEMIDKFTPHEIGYDDSRIDFEKGCYTGQEIVARMQYRAKKLPTVLVRSTKKEVEILSKVFDKNKNFEITHEMIDKFTPHEIGYNDSRIDFEKGCYTGQEIVARMQYRAKNYRQY